MDSSSWCGTAALARVGHPKRQQESFIRKSIVLFLSYQPYTFVWVNSTTGIPRGGGGFYKNPHRGIADIVGLHRGQAFAFEVKTSTGKVSPWQERWLENFKNAGGSAHVVRSVQEAEECFASIVRRMKDKFGA